MVFLSFLAFYFWQQYRTVTTRIQSIREDGEEMLIEKGTLLVQDKSISFKEMVYDNGWNSIQRVLSENIKADRDMVVAGLVRTSYDLRAWASPENLEADVFQPGSRDLVPALAGKVRIENGHVYLQDKTTEWALSVNKSTNTKITIDGKLYYQFATPIMVPIYQDDESAIDFDQEQKAAAVFYRFSTEGMERRVEAEKAAYYQKQRQTLYTTSGIGAIALLAGFLFMRRQAATITQPLGVLTNAAEALAAGDYDVKVTVASGDELEVLADAFNKMVQDLARSYADLRTRNVQLEDARNALENLNRNLEFKVEERTKQLAESESKFRTLFEESADAILLGSEEYFLDCNPALLEMMGCTSKDQLISLHLADISPELQPDETPSAEKLLFYFRKAREQGSLQFEWVNRRVDGTTFHTEIVITSFPLGGRQIFHMVFRDISERKRTEAALKEAQAQLVETAHSAGMAEIATGVLHNIGNILNSVNISTEEISHTLKISKVKGFLKANELLARNLDNAAEFLSEHPKGKLVPGYYISLGDAIREEHQIMTDEIRALSDKVSMMRDVISTQQNYAKATLYTEDIVVTDLVDDALKLQLASLKKQGVKIKKDFRAHPRGMVSKVKLVHVLTNLIKNGKEAMGGNEKLHKTQEMIIRIEEPSERQVQIQIEDNGCGIRRENLEKIFNHGFTTKNSGHGFGLHTCANFMTEMGGSLQAYSDGEGMGAVFTLRFPLMHADELI